MGGWRERGKGVGEGLGMVGWIVGWWGFKRKTYAIINKGWLLKMMAQV